MPIRGDDPARLLNRRYLASFALVALLLLANGMLVQPQILALAVDPPMINRAGRQRMLGQRLAKAALAVARPGRRAERDRYLAELEEARSALADAHGFLRRGLGDRSGPSGAIRARLDALEPPFLRLQGAAGRLVSASEPHDIQVAVDAILADEAAYLRQMESVVGLYEARARERVDRLLWTGRALSGLALVALGGVGWLVLRPATGIILRQISDLEHANDALEDKVSERTAELERANRHLEIEAERRSVAEARHRSVLEVAGQAARVNTLGEMASSLAHELNQPLGAIANYAEGCLVELDRPAPDVSEVRAALGKVLANALRAGEVIKRVRRFVTRGELGREPIEPRRLLDEVADLLRDEADRRRIALRVEAAPDLPWVWGDPVQIQQVLINLVRNAYDAIDASETSRRAVVMSATPVGIGRVEFRVEDDGEGIPEGRLARVFEPYFSTRAEGMGLGLAISRTIVETHEGILAVESEPGVGTTFRFTIPTIDAGDDAGRHGLRR